MYLYKNDIFYFHRPSINICSFLFLWSLSINGNGQIWYLKCKFLLRNLTALMLEIWKFIFLFWYTPWYEMEACLLQNQDIFLSSKSRHSDPSFARKKVFFNKLEFQWHQRCHLILVRIMAEWQERDLQHHFHMY